MGELLWTITLFCVWTTCRTLVFAFRLLLLFSTGKEIEDDKHAYKLESYKGLAMRSLFYCSLNGFWGSKWKPYPTSASILVPEGLAPLKVKTRMMWCTPMFFIIFAVCYLEYTVRRPLYPEVCAALPNSSLSLRTRLHSRNVLVIWKGEHSWLEVEFQQ